MENCYNVNIPTKEFYNSRKNPLTSVPSEKDTWFNTGYDCFTIEVSGAESIEATVKGCLNITDADNKRIAANDRAFSALKIIDLSTYKAVEKITHNGLYAVGVSGIANIFVDIASLSGSVTIVGSTGVWGD